MTELNPDTNGIKKYSSNDPEYRALVERMEREKKEEEERLKNSKDAFFVYYVIDYFATGEGRTIFLFIERNYGDRERILESIKEDVGSFYFCGIEEFSEERFLNDYSNLLSDNIKRMIEKKDVPFMSFSQMYHFNYS